jgi:hypothetical protein
MGARLDCFAAALNAAEGLPRAPLNSRWAKFTDPALNF